MMPPLRGARLKAVNSMRLLRLLTIIATLLSLPAYGLAAVTHTRSCQEQVNTAQQAAMADDCCPHEAGKKAPCEQPGKSDECSTCNTGHNCKSPQTYQPAQLSITVIIPARQVAVGVPPTHLSSHSPDLLLRPPSPI